MHVPNAKKRGPTHPAQPSYAGAMRACRLLAGKRQAYAAGYDVAVTGPLVRAYVANSVARLHLEHGGTRPRTRGGTPLNAAARDA